MNISTITGSNEPLDNWTSLYTFAFGIVGGSFLAIGVGEIDLQQGLRGDLLRIYLALITAMLGGGIGLFVTRMTDRIKERRATWRKTFAAKRRIETLVTEIERIFSFDQNTPLEADRNLTFYEMVVIPRIVEDIVKAAADVPNFDELVESEEDQEQADRVIRNFRWCSKQALPAKGADDDGRARLTAMQEMVEQPNIAAFEVSISELRFAAEHFTARARAQ